MAYSNPVFPFVARLFTTLCGSTAQFGTDVRGCGPRLHRLHRRHIEHSVSEEKEKKVRKSSFPSRPWRQYLLDRRIVSALETTGEGRDEEPHTRHRSRTTTSGTGIPPANQIECEGQRRPKQQRRFHSSKYSFFFTCRARSAQSSRPPRLSCRSLQRTCLGTARGEGWLGLSWPWREP